MRELVRTTGRSADLAAMQSPRSGRARPRRTAGIGAVLAAGLAAAASSAGAEVPRVTVDISPIHGLVSQVMGDLGTPSLVVRPGATPHGYNMRPSEARAVQDADIVFWVGEALTPWLEEPLETLAEGAHVIELIEAPGVALLEVREGALFPGHDDHGHGDHGHDDHGHDDHADAEHAAHDDHDHEEHADHDDHAHDEHEEHASGDAHDHDHDHDHEEHAEHDDHDHEEHAEHDDHAHEDHAGEEHAEHADHDDHDHEEHAEADAHGHDDHGHEEAGHDHAHSGTDPHLWLDPANASIWLAVIADELAEADPDNAEIYSANAEAAQAELDALAAEIETRLEPARGVPFVVFHDAYQYFEEAFDLSATGAISMSDAQTPSAARLREVQGRIAELGAVCVGVEPQFDPRVIDAVTEGQPVGTALMDPLGANIEPGAGHYAATLLALADALAGCAPES